MTSAIAPLAVTIPAPAQSDSAAAFFAKSAKGEIRTDAAAPPTAAQAPGEFSFADLLDVVNPLQHLPGVNLVYQAITGDKIQPITNLAGGLLYGGPIGGAIAMASSVFGELFKASEAADAVQVADANPARPDIFKLG